MNSLLYLTNNLSKLYYEHSNSLIAKKYLMSLCKFLKKYAQN
jgi:hypothetical protein